jgi:zinc D-Ala-D-Ala carboxypeptidase
MLTEHFSIGEFTRSARHPELNEKNLAASGPYLQNMLRVCAQLEVLREYIARPIFITSGFRCPELNAAVGGVPGSAHVRGLAADFTVKDFQDPDGLFGIFKWCVDNFASGQIIFEHPAGRKPWIHYAIADNPESFAGSRLETLTFINGEWKRYARG